MKRKFCLVTGDLKTAYIGNTDLSDAYFNIGHFQTWSLISVSRAYYALLSLGIIRLEPEVNPKEYYENIVKPFVFEQRDIPVSETDKLRAIKIRKFVENVYEVNLEDSEQKEMLVSLLINNISEFQLNTHANQLIRNVIYESVDLSVYEDSEDYINDILLVQPYEHQKRAINRWLNIRKKRHNNKALFLEPRLGKTLITLYALVHTMHEKQTRENQYGTSLIVAPVRTLSTVWKRQFRQFINEKYRKDFMIVVLTEIPVRQRVQFILSARELAESLKKHIIIVTNYETFSRLNTEATKDFHKLELFDFVCLDEAHKIKDPTTKQSQNIFNILKSTNTKFVLTGTPYGNSYTDTWQILKFIEDAPFACYSLSQFTYNYGYVYNGKFVLTRRREFFDHLGKIAEIVRQQDVDFLMPEIDVVYLDMVSEHRQKYQSIIDKAKAEVADGVIQIPNILSLIAKLRQASSGFLYYQLEDGAPRQSSRLVKPEEVEKFAHTMELIDENIDTTQIVLCLTFEEEYEIFKELLQELNKNRSRRINYDLIRGGISASAQNEIIERFQEGKIDLLIVNPKAASLGLDLSVANLMIYPSYGWSLIEERQMRDRCVSPHKKIATKVIYVAHNESIDVRIMEALKDKRENLEEVMKRGNTKLIEWLAGVDK